MCGITGVLNDQGQPPVEETVILQMLEMIRYRGPDGFGIYRDSRIGMGSARLSIIDLNTGDQPISNEDGTLWIVFNGEIFNYLELRAQLVSRGHIFKTQSDTEVLLHLYEDHGSGCLQHLNGQFAFAIWDSRQDILFLARDRAGIRPLFYTAQKGRWIFASEIKSILAFPGIQADIELNSLRQVFTFWSVQSPSTVFKGIFEIPPGHYAVIRHGEMNIQPYWSLRFEEEPSHRTIKDYLEEFEALLIDAVKIRLRADVPVGAYISGGLDSSVVASIIRKFTRTHLDTFSIAFSDPDFDESTYQRQMASFLGTDHHSLTTTHEDIGKIFPEVIWHTETPVLRTAPAPMYLLSRLVREHQYKVVLTGEGADELLAGYDIFKEMKIRRFWARNPESEKRPMLLHQLYPDISGIGGSQGFLRSFFNKDLTRTTSPYYSHAIRWSNTSRTWRFFLNDQVTTVDALMPEAIRLPQAYPSWTPLSQAQYLEFTTFLSPYLLSSQGDRMAMGHSVEGRYPFLDYRVMEFSIQLPSDLRMPALAEKWLLKQLGHSLVPDEIWKRVKRPYRAPIHKSFFTSCALEYVVELLSEDALKESALFDPFAVTKLIQKVEAGAKMSEVEDMALVGILSTQLVYQQFIKGFQLMPIRKQISMKVVDRVPVAY